MTGRLCFELSQFLVGFQYFPVLFLSLASSDICSSTLEIERYVFFWHTF